MNPRKLAFFIVIGSAIPMFILPLLIILFVRSDAAMGLCFILFFAVNPALSVWIGILSGRALEERKLYPLIPPVVFVCSSWILFTPLETAFLLYAGCYLVFGAAAMLISFLVYRYKRSKQ